MAQVVSAVFMASAKVGDLFLLYNISIYHGLNVTNVKMLNICK